MDDLPLPLNRWGRIASPAEAAGAYLYAELEPGDGWKQPPPADAIRVWQRRPGVEDDDDLNWTTWLQEPDLEAWLRAKGYEFAEWLPEGAEPDWTNE